MIASWLATLPRSGWTGGAAELFATLDGFACAVHSAESIPTGSALTKALLREELTVCAASFALHSRRTEAAPYIVFAPADFARWYVVNLQELVIT